LVEQYLTKILSQDISRVPGSINMVWLDFVILYCISNIVISDVNMFGPFFLALGLCSRRVIQGYHHRGEGQEYQNQSHSGDLISRQVSGYSQRAPYTQSQ